MATGNKRRASNTLSKQPLDLPPATIHAFAGSTAPEGWDMCDGAAISRTDYAALFAVIGTTYGVGDGSTTFNLPDTRGQFLRALDDMGTAAGAAGVDVDGTARTVGQTQSNATAKNGLSASQASHSHEAGTPSLDNGTYAKHGAGAGAGAFVTANAGAGVYPLTNGKTPAITVGAGDTETRPTNLGINYIIKL